MTEKRLDFDWKNSHQRTLTLEHDQKFTPMNVNLWTWLKYGWIRLKINKFRSYSHFNVCRFGNIYWSSSKVNIRRCQFFGHVHQFWSYSFGHLDSVIWITLYYFPSFNLLDLSSNYDNYAPMILFVVIKLIGFPILVKLFTKRGPSKTGILSRFLGRIGS